MSEANGDVSERDVRTSTRRLRSRTAGDRGSATVELAAGLPVLVLLLLVGLAAIMVVLAQLRCVDTAREVVRAQARGESGMLIGQRASPGSAIAISSDGEFVRARVSMEVHPLGGRLPSFTVTADAVAANEPFGRQ